MSAGSDTPYCYWDPWWGWYCTGYYSYGTKVTVDPQDHVIKWDQTPEGSNKYTITLYTFEGQQHVYRHITSWELDLTGSAVVQTTVPVTEPVISPVITPVPNVVPRQSVKHVTVTSTSASYSYSSDTRKSASLPTGYVRAPISVNGISVARVKLRRMQPSPLRAETQSSPGWKCTVRTPCFNESDGGW